MLIVFCILSLDFPKLMEVTDELYEKLNIKFIIHSPSAVNESIVHTFANNHLANNISLYQIELARSNLNSNIWKAAKHHYLGFY